uniref:T9SS type A sorting domain-containing protein n=1 Tax=uncultured Psychroserpens sp. TaxID=255436 RepID=UPI002621D917
KVVNITDFKFAPTTTKLKHRAYLYYDTNTSDRQFFYAPRAEMVDGNEPPLADLLGLNEIDTNLLDDSSWTIGCGSVSGFTQYGVTSENCRELGENHIGKDVVLWKAIPNSDGAQSGGFGSSYININHTKDYRLSVWMKKTNSNDGLSYFKLTSLTGSSHHTLKLNGTVQTWPSFWNGDLPQLNRWYLLVGYIHNSSYASSVSHGKIYDGVTGEVVQSITDYKFKSTATNLQHRAFIYGDTNINDRQYMYAPRMEEVNGSEWTLEELLSINPDSKLIFSYDLAGNQKQRFYCEEEGFCSPVAPESRMINEEGVKMEEEGVVVAEQTDVPLPGEETKEDTDLTDVKHTIYPNPTDGKIAIKLSGKDYNLTNSINIYTSSGALVRRININNPTNQIELNISDMPSGTYHIHMHFTNGTVKTEQIIKN